VVARPFPKFFNHGEPEAAALDLADRVTVTDKADGSLGILYPGGAGWEVATRGSFASEQAIHATRVWRDRYQGKFFPDSRFTYLFEIVYPQNRIVVDYGDLDDLVHLGCVDLDTGKTFGPDPDWIGPTIETFPYGSFAEALAAEPRPNREGMVVHFQGSDQRVKIKQADYLRLHKIVTGLSARTVWEHLAAGGPLDALIEPLPDEFHPWVREVAEHLNGQIEGLITQIERSYAQVIATVPNRCTRKEFALVAKTKPNAWALFNKADQRDYVPKLWRQIDPGGEWRPTSYSEDAA
jgi:RNA ligase